jgi:hypothetical protein
MSRNDELTWLNIDNHRGAGTWLEEMRARGVAVPLALCRGVSQAMEALAMSFPEAFRVLWRNHAIVLVGRTLIYDLTADRLWRQKDSANAPSETPPGNGSERSEDQARGSSE